MDLKPIEKLRPFQKFCITIGELPVSYLESMTYLELLYWLLNFLQEKVIPAVNNNAEAVKELQTLFVELKNYVDNYFDNLDVQEEINNKLDAMVEDGTLDTILNNYRKFTRIYNTYIEMIADSDTFVNNEKIKTLGYYSINDGGSAEYFITSTEIENMYQELHNSLYLTMLNYNNQCNIKQFGAYGDNNHDDTEAFKNAILYFSKIYFPSGTYIISENIILQNKHIFGDSSSLSSIKFINSSLASDYGILKLQQGSSIEKLNLIDSVTDNGCFVHVTNNNGGYIKESIVQSVDNIRCGAIIDIATNTKNFTISKTHTICKTNADGGLWIRTNSATGTTENITIDSCIIEQFGRDEPIAIWGWNGTVQNVYVKDTKIIMQENVNETNVHLIRVGYDGTLKNVFFDNCEITGKYTSQVTIIESDGTNENINFTNCKINVVTSSSRAIVSGKIKFYNCIFNSTLRNKLSESSNAYFYNCIYNCEKQGSFNNGNFYNCINNNNSEIETSSSYLSTGNKAKYINCEINGVNFNNNSGQFINLLANGQIEFDNVKFNGTITTNFFILATNINTIIKLKNSILNAKSYFGNNATGYICFCLSNGILDGGTNIFKYSNSTSFSG